MKKNLSILFSVASILYVVYIIYMGVTNPDGIHYSQMLTLIALLSITSYFITFGAFQDVDNERK